MFSQRAFGPEAQATARRAQDLSQLLLDLGKPVNAEAVAQDALAMRPWPPCPPDATTLVLSLLKADALRRQNRLEEALLEAERAASAATDPPANLIYIQDWKLAQARCLATRGQILAALGESAKAERLLRKAVADQIRRDPWYCPLQMILARFLREHGRAEEALKELEDHLRRHLWQGELSHPVGAIRSEIGACLLDLGRHEEAEHSLVEAEQVLNGVSGRHIGHLRTTLERLIRHAGAQGDAAQERVWRSRLEELLTR